MLNCFQVATDTGVVQMFDARNDDKAVWTLKAHSEGVNGLVMSTQCPGCLITGSSDKTIKVWDIADGKPTCVHDQNMKLGMIHCMSGCPDAPFVTVMGGDKSSDNIKVFDVREAAAVRNRYKHQFEVLPNCSAGKSRKTSKSRRTRAADTQGPLIVVYFMPR